MQSITEFMTDVALFQMKETNAEAKNGGTTLVAERAKTEKMRQAPQEWWPWWWPRWSRRKLRNHGGSPRQTIRVHFTVANTSGKHVLMIRKEKATKAVANKTVASEEEVVATQDKAMDLEDKEVTLEAEEAEDTKMTTQIISPFVKMGTALCLINLRETMNQSSALVTKTTRRFNAVHGWKAITWTELDGTQDVVLLGFRDVATTLGPGDPEQTPVKRLGLFRQQTSWKMSVMKIVMIRMNLKISS